MNRRLRPVDLAREHGLSAQAVRTYERDGVLPPAVRTVGGHRAYTPEHARALRAFVALVPAHGHAAAREILRAVGADDLERALRLVDDGHDRLRRDRATLDAVAAAVGLLRGGPTVPVLDAPLSVGELARRIAVVVAQVRDAGGTAELAASLSSWRDRLTARGRAMLVGAGALAAHLDGLRDPAG